MEERLGEMRKREDEKGAIVSSSPQGMTSWSSSIKIWFFQAYRMHIKMSWYETECKNMCIGEQNVINRSLYLRRTKY